MADLYEAVGPAFLLKGDPTVSGGTAMNNLSDTENVVFNAGIRMAFTSSARLSGAPKATRIFSLPPNPIMQAQLKELGADNLAAVIDNGVLAGTDAFLPGDEFTALTVPDTVVAVPVEQRASGVAAKNAIWLPAAFAQGVDGVTWGRTQEGEINQPWNTEVRGGYRLIDQTTPTGVSIQAGGRLWFMGNPADLTPALTWFLPSLT